MLSNTSLAVATSADVAVGELVPVTLMGVELVLWRDTDGVVHTWEDYCVRGVRLSLGHVTDDTVVCRLPTRGTTTAPAAAPSCPPTPS